MAKMGPGIQNKPAEAEEAPGSPRKASGHQKKKTGTPRSRSRAPGCQNKPQEAQEAPGEPVDSGSRKFTLPRWCDDIHLVIEFDFQDFGLSPEPKLKPKPQLFSLPIKTNPLI